MQLACRHDERSGESYEVLDGKKRRKRVLKNVVCNLLTRDLVGEWEANHCGVWHWLLISQCKNKKGRTFLQTQLPSSGDVHKKSSTCHANFFKKSMHMQVKKTFLFGCSMHRANKHTQGSFLPARTAAKMALASSLLYAPVWVQFTSYIPACLSHSHQPSKLQKPAEALQKISTLPIGSTLGACIPVWHKNTSASNCKPHCFKTRFVSSRSKCCCFVATHMNVNSLASDTWRHCPWYLSTTCLPQILPVLQNSWGAILNCTIWKHARAPNGNPTAVALRQILSPFETCQQFPSVSQYRCRHTCYFAGFPECWIRPTTNFNKGNVLFLVNTVDDIPNSLQVIHRLFFPRIWPMKLCGSVLTSC